ncbi:MAG: putative transporter [Tepidisphaeraceae bacterium]
MNIVPGLLAEAATTHAATSPATAPASTNWLVDLFINAHGTASVAHSVLILMVVSAIGIALGHLKFKGISLGIAWVLFVGLAVSALKVEVNAEVLEFLRDFGLILFVFTIGMQVGPGFFASLRKSGLPLNLAAAAIVLSGVVVTVICYFVAFKHDPTKLPQSVGLLTGAVTNTPSMGAAKEALVTMKYPTGSGSLLTQAYAIAYPLGVFGVLAAMIGIRLIFGIDVAQEQKQLSAAHKHPTLDVTNLEVINPALAGRKLGDVPTLSNSGVVVTRLLRGKQVEVADDDAVLQPGDVLTAVGPAKALAAFELIVGKRTHVDARAVTSDIDVRRILVSNKHAVGPTIEELNLRDRFGVQLTRIVRAGFELPVTADSRLQYGDRVAVVGDRDALPAVVKELGDSLKALDKPLLAPILVGIALGVIVGSIPIAMPGLPAPMKLGLAGGPLVIALLLSRLYKIGPLVWYMPSGANYFLRELGIVLFLACVGLKSGGNFVEVFRANGALWLPLGFAITFIPVMTVGVICRAVFKMNYMTLVGLMAGSMTDPPALAFSQQVTGSDAPTVSYATVYPLVMLLRILTAQLIVLLLGHAV